ncbi:hypothetical protein E4U43_008082 [Claviceps pusilla]|uniref:Cx9C motif-containing protein 4, mitochondrial n=1 Tax=Claviceps pusilla TaxID=123648 RepID=A0A9P7NGK9_9HYPO|nr:hypothetical protein E4U43_008082 [Claviceps pusilla]
MPPTCGQFDMRSENGDPARLTEILSAASNCLTRNNYNDAKCQDVVRALYDCCDAFYQKYGDEATTPSCPKPNLLRLKIQQMKNGQ